MPTPITLVASGGIPVTEATGASPYTPVDSGGVAATLVASGGQPVTLVNDDLSPWSGGSVTINVGRTLGPGNDGVTQSSGTGTVTSTETYTNETGMQITEIALVFCGWRHVLNAADTLMPATYNPTWSVNSQSGTAPAVTAGDTITTEWMTLDTPIAIGANFSVTVTAVDQVVPLSRDTVNSRFRPSGIVTRKPTSEVAANCPLRLYLGGDSIFTNSGLPPTAAAAGICPSVQLSIIGETAFQQVGNMTRRVALAQALGCTHAVFNYLANDHGAARTLAQMKASLTSIAGDFSAAGMQVLWTTNTPAVVATSAGTVSVTSATHSAGIVTATCASGGGAYFQTGQLFALSGANEADYNRTLQCTDVTGDVVQLRCPSTAPASATGTLVLNRVYGYRSQQASRGGNYAHGSDFGATSLWAQMNDWIRAGGDSAFDDYIEIADALTPARNDCRFITGNEVGNDTLRADKDLLTVAEVDVQLTRFGFASDGDTYGNSWANGGVGQWLTGLNTGLRFTVASTAQPRDLLLSAATTNNITVGDTFCFRPTNTMQATTDGLHPNLVATWGGVVIMQNTLAAKFAAMKAAL